MGKIREDEEDGGRRVREDSKRKRTRMGRR